MTSAFEYWQSGEGMANITPPGNRWPEGKWFRQDFEDRFFAQDVVEFGCGDGRLAQFFGWKKYIGIDICLKALVKARQENPKYTFRLCGREDKIEGGHVLMAHCVLMHIPDADLVPTLKRFTQRRLVVSEMLGEEWRREGNPPVFNRGLQAYERAFVQAGYMLRKVQFRTSDHYKGKDIAILEAHKVEPLST